jgi:hypothetical protein
MNRGAAAIFILLRTGMISMAVFVIMTNKSVEGSISG